MIALFGAIATFLVAVVALFGDAIKAKWLGPKLRLDLLSPLGNLTSVPPTKDEAERKTRPISSRAANKPEKVVEGNTGPSLPATS